MKRCFAGSLLMLVGFAACASTQRAAPDPAEEASAAPLLLGPLERDEIERALPDWVAEEATSEPDLSAAEKLLAVTPGGEVTVFLRTTCSDSRRELARLWSALDAIGGDVPFLIRYVGVDRGRREPAALVAGQDLRFVPTFIVERDGREVGRIVETSPGGIESDLVLLLTDEAHGVLSTRTDLEEPLEQP